MHYGLKDEDAEALAEVYGRVLEGVPSGVR